MHRQIPARVADVDLPERAGRDVKARIGGIAHALEPRGDRGHQGSESRVRPTQQAERLGPVAALYRAELAVRPDALELQHDPPRLGIVAKLGRDRHGPRDVARLLGLLELSHARHAIDEIACGEIVRVLFRVGGPDFLSRVPVLPPHRDQPAQGAKPVVARRHAEADLDLPFGVLDEIVSVEDAYQALARIRVRGRALEMTIHRPRAPRRDWWCSGPPAARRRPRRHSAARPPPKRARTRVGWYRSRARRTRPQAKAATRRASAVRRSRGTGSAASAFSASSKRRALSRLRARTRCQSSVAVGCSIILIHRSAASEWAPRSSRIRAASLIAMKSSGKRANASLIAASASSSCRSSLALQAIPHHGIGRSGRSAQRSRHRSRARR